MDARNRNRTRQPHALRKFLWNPLVLTYGSQLVEEKRTRVQTDHFAESGRFFYENDRTIKTRNTNSLCYLRLSHRRRPYQPGMSDYNIFIKEQSQVFLGGPPLVKMATGEIADAETIGGGQMHAEKSGLADYLAEDEMDAIRLCREVVSHLDWKKAGPEPSYVIDPPIHDSEELLGLVSRDLRQPL